MPIRNPFARRPGLMIPHEESIGSDSSSSLSAADPAHPGFERVDTVGSKASSALSVRSRRSQDTGEYKMSGMIAIFFLSCPFLPCAFVSLPLRSLATPPPPIFFPKAVGQSTRG